MLPCQSNNSVLLDFSAGSDAALARAIPIAERAGARMTLLHATGPRGVVPDEAHAAIVAAGADSSVSRTTHGHPALPRLTFFVRIRFGCWIDLYRLEVGKQVVDAAADQGLRELAWSVLLAEPDSPDRHLARPV